MDSEMDSEIDSDINNEIIHLQLEALKTCNREDDPSNYCLSRLNDDVLRLIGYFLFSTIDYITKYLEEEIYTNNKNKQNEYLSLYRILNPKLVKYVIKLHNNPKKNELCKNWCYGVEFLLTSTRHCNGGRFYDNYSHEESLCLDFKLQVACINKPRSEILDKTLLEYLLPLNKGLRIDLECGMDGTPLFWEEKLGYNFQKLIDLPTERQNEVLSIWRNNYVKNFTLSLRSHENGQKIYFRDDPSASWISSFITDFMMYQYH
jgi:hypothetical protein